MRVLVLGSGARAHALLNSLLGSRHEIWCHPKPELWHPHVSVHAVPNGLRITELAEWAKRSQIDLVLGLDEHSAFGDAATYFQEMNIVYFGPTHAAARLEESKLFARSVLEELGFQAPRLLRIATRSEDDCPPDIFPVFLRLSRSDSARGVRFVRNPQEFKEAFRSLVKLHENGGCGGKFAILIEEYLIGFEVTFSVFAGAEEFIELPPVRDYKALCEGDTGVLTSGMGGYSPVPALAPDWIDFQRNLFAKVLERLKSASAQYVGYLNANVIYSQGRWFVLEFNCHMGDPDLVLLLAQINGDLANALYDLATGNKTNAIDVVQRPSVAVSLASKGYPEAIISPSVIQLPENTTGLYIFRARMEGDSLFSLGGRVLLASATSSTFTKAVEQCYNVAEAAQTANPALVFRRDIGKEVML